MRLGYITSAPEEVDQFIDELGRACVDVIYVDEIQHGKSTREGLQEMLRDARPGDCIVILRLASFADNIEDLLQILTNLDDLDLSLQSVNDGLDPLTCCKSFFATVRALETAQTDFKQGRRFPGLKAARAAGRLGGRRPVLNDERKRQLDELFTQSSDFHSHARKVGVSVRTVKRYAYGQYPH